MNARSPDLGGKDAPARDTPLPAELRVREGRDTYLQENGFTAAAYDAAWTKASFFGIPMRVPNTMKHRRAIMLHDLHHVVTGYGTDMIGEAEVSAWELRRGLRGLGLYVGAIVTSIVLIGLVRAPTRTVRAFRAAPGPRSLFQETMGYDELLGLTVGELRKSLGLPRDGLALGTRGLHPDAPRS